MSPLCTAFTDDENKNESRFFFLIQCATNRVFQLYGAKSDFLDCLTLNTLYYVYHNHISCHD